ncbi:hypothetical protein [Micromonospora sp. WP24]|uniref:hypothetical protein n=1 Tax=Micromonospora sp. WP24 TaxID=2604469 RepID=UPI0021038BE3|nr:hypothetical protein [Micromonospora sp. WP24]
MRHTAEGAGDPDHHGCRDPTLAGVGRSAVGNWCKRYADFPSPVGGTSASPEFDLMQVEQWLRGQGKLPESATANRLWRRVAAASRTPAASSAAIGELHADPYALGCVLFGLLTGDPPHQADSSACCIGT